MEIKGENYVEEDNRSDTDKDKGHLVRRHCSVRCLYADAIIGELSL
jgi:hypothetical protein